MVEDRSLAKLRNTWLDGLRGSAIVGVVAVHSMQISNLILGNKETTFSGLISLGKYGVEHFFWLSGWLLVSIYGLKGNRLGKTYGIRRIARIYPLWVLFLIVGIVRSSITNSGGFYKAQSFYSDAWIILLSLTFLLFTSSALWNTVIPGGWSIQAEVAHYLLFPIMRNRSLALLLSGATVVNLMTLVLLYFRSRVENWPKLTLQIFESYIRLGLYSSLGFFIIGILSFQFFEDFSCKRKGIRKPDGAGIPKLLTITFLLSLMAVPCPVGSNLEALIYVATMTTFIFAIKRVNVIFELFQFLGRYSYFIYFIHFLVLDLIRIVTKGVKSTYFLSFSTPLFFVLVLGFTITVSSILALPSMKFFEKPILKFAHRHT
jgi:peptidoglycan/LPS O-acetylase OafA/YrhL